jgi:uncharacterized tellurite resistance protein B-like protein
LDLDVAVLRSIKTFFEQKISFSQADNQTNEEDRIRLATAALLFEISKADYDSTQIEIDTVHAAVQNTFGLPDADAQELVRLAAEEVSAASSYHEFTSLINKNFSADQKIQVVENLWRVAYADGRLDKYEEHLIRRLADLLHVPHTQFIAAKHRVQDDR